MQASATRWGSAGTVSAVAEPACPGVTSGSSTKLAMKTWRLRLALADGSSTLPARTALARYLAAWIGPVLALAAYAGLHRHGLGAHATWLVAFNFLWALVDPARQFLHDRVAGTRIVDAVR